MEQGGGREPQNYRHNTTTLPTLCEVTTLFAERQHSVPRLADIWIPKLVASPNHFVRLYVPGVEDLFQVGDRLLKVEHSGSRSRLISWRIWRNQEEGWRFQQESADEQKISTFASNVTPLRPVAEGVQSGFAKWLG
jgi:hypothetical protein